MTPPPEMFAAFGLDPNDACRRTSGGWINDTFIVGSPPVAVLQRISRSYFTDAEGVMENLVRLVGHLEWKLKFEDGGGERWFPKIRNATSGKPYLFDEDGSIWRAMEYIPGHAPTMDLNPTILRGGAEMYGRFLNRIEDIVDPPLRCTIDWYRDLDAITAGFFAAWDAATPERRQQMSPAMARLEALIARVETATGSLDEGALRRRPVHGDTKLANLLLRPDSDQIAAVIDLDVAMDGAAAHDFGDLLRSTAQKFSADPDGPYQADTVRDVFTVLSEGFVAGAGASLSDEEITALPSAGPRICLELGLRYLTEVTSGEPVLVPDDPDRAWRKGLRNLTFAEGMLDDADALHRQAQQLLDR